LTKVTCGQGITQSIRVANDLKGCDTGLRAEVSNITIDLNGHTIAGNGADEGGGVSVSHVDGVVVRNGTVRDFRVGIGTDVTVDTVVSRVRAVDNFAGYSFSESFRVQLVDSSAQGGEFGARIGLLAGGARVTRFKASQNARAGVYVGPLSNGNVVERSDVAGAGVGIHLTESGSNTVSRNRVRDSRVGILVEAFSNANRILGNDVTRSSETGISVNDQSGDASHDNVLRDNRVTRSGGDGIFVGDAAPGTVVARNQALHNDLLGINAPFGAVDGGGNRAHGNGDPRQCVGVACRR
jgi:parallel beta-helix repeat protein